MKQWRSTGLRMVNYSEQLEVGELRAVREALNQELVLGTEGFKDKIETMVKRQTRPGLPGTRH